MKKIIALAIMALMFSGCATLTDALKNPTLTRIYDTTKVILVDDNKTVREVVISNFDLLSESDQANLLKIDKETKRAINDYEKIKRDIEVIKNATK